MVDVETDVVDAGVVGATEPDADVGAGSGEGGSFTAVFDGFTDVGDGSGVGDGLDVGAGVGFEVGPGFVVGVSGTDGAGELATGAAEAGGSVSAANTGPAETPRDIATASAAAAATRDSRFIFAPPVPRPPLGR
ncbi:hypothetical protein ACWEGE_05160 [Amycolatopsis sp. NPDC004747]